MKNYRYGFSDIIVGEVLPAKYIKVFSEDGIYLGEVECYFIEEEKEEKDE